MKIKTLAALCKKAGVFYLYDRITDDGEVAEQWLGNGGAVYPLHGLPYMQENNLLPSLISRISSRIKSISGMSICLPRQSILRMWIQKKASLTAKSSQLGTREGF